MARLGIIVALKHEKKALGDLDRDTSCHLLTSGIGRINAGRAAEHAIERGCEALLSLGVSGGLDPRLKSGAVLIPSRVIDQNSKNDLSVDSEWRDRLLSRIHLGQAVKSTVTTDHLVSSRDEKSDLWTTLGASAVDMEASEVLSVATRAGLPGLVVRVVADPSSVALPRFISNRVDQTEPGLLEFMSAVASEPSDLPQILNLAVNGRRALNGLSRVARLAGPGFAF